MRRAVVTWCRSLMQAALMISPDCLGYGEWMVLPPKETPSPLIPPAIPMLLASPAHPGFLVLMGWLDQLAKDQAQHERLSH